MRKREKMETYLKKGYSKEWINQRLKSIEVRKELTDEWDTLSLLKMSAVFGLYWFALEFH